MRAWWSAVKSGDIEGVKKIVQSNPSILEERDEEGNTALLVTAYLGHLEVVDFLISMKADINAKGRNNTTPLNFASWGIQESIANRLLNAGAIVDCPDDGGNTPLLWSCMMESPGIVHSLLKAGADPNRPNERGETPFAVASRNKCKVICDDLISFGVNQRIIAVSDWKLYNLPIEEKLEAAEHLKTTGNREYKENSFEKALEAYRTTLTMLEKFHRIPDEAARESAKAIYVTCLTNSASCLLRLQRWKDVLLVTSHALSLDPTNAKALHRRGQAYIAMEQWEEAVVDLEAANKTLPLNQEILTALKLAKGKLREEKNRAGEIFGRMFGGETK
eukprot:c11415_g1_i1.p1 GENE.c11415_g1_i1~~c11415_g1_i1.p1  ORF type:complete len:333 (-),score=68.48 c11415_g1_i1:134-1132(-)